MQYKFEDIAINSTAKKKPTEEDKDTYIGLEHLDSDCLYVTRWGADAAPTGEKLLMKKGDVLFGKRRAYQRKVGIAPFDGIFSAHGMVLRPNEEIIDKDFFPFFISSDQFMERAVRISVGGLSPTINWKDLRVQEFTLPTIEEQRILADKLWAAYRLKESYKKLLTATQEMVKSQFIEMFGDPNKGNWTASVADYCYILGGFAFKSDLFSSTGVPIVRISNINDGVVDIDQSINYGYDFWVSNPSYRVLDGDILMAMSGATTGKVGVFRQNVPALLNQRVACIRQKEGKSVSSFLYAALQSEFMYKTIQSSTQGGAQPNISSKQISKLPMPAANILDQKKFESIAQQADKSEFELRQAIEKIDKVIKSLIN